jgi:hypothetical protein
MLRSDTIAELAKALAQAQTAFDAIKRDRTVKVQTKTGGSYTFAYAPLDTILAAIRPALAQHGLALVQASHMDNGAEFLRTTLLHASGENIANDTAVLVSDRGPQAYGSALTYAARYGVTRLLCLASEEDDDGNAAEGHAAERIQRSRKTEKAEPITAEQAADLQTWAAELGVDLQQFCKFMNVPSLSAIPADRYDSARNALEAKQRAKRKAELEVAP